MQSGILRDADHGEDLLKVGRKPKSGNRLIRLASFHQHLDDQSNSTRIDVFHFGEIDQNRPALDDPLIGSEDGIPRTAGDIAREAKDGDRLPIGGEDLIDFCFGLRLHFTHSPWQA